MFLMMMLGFVSFTVSRFLHGVAESEPARDSAQREGPRFQSRLRRLFAWLLAAARGPRETRGRVVSAGAVLAGRVLCRGVAGVYLPHPRIAETRPDQRLTAKKQDMRSFAGKCFAPPHAGSTTSAQINRKSMERRSTRGLSKFPQRFLRKVSGNRDGFFTWPGGSHRASALCQRAPVPRMSRFRTRPVWIAIPIRTSRWRRRTARRFRFSWMRRNSRPRCMRPSTARTATRI